jgi:hypothetical protein
MAEVAKAASMTARTVLACIVVVAERARGGLYVKAKKAAQKSCVNGWR